MFHIPIKHAYDVNKLYLEFLFLFPRRLPSALSPVHDEALTM